MPLTSLGFLFVFLPAGGLLYYFLRGAGRRIFLLCYSLLFVGLLSPLCLLLLLAVTVPDYLLARPLAMAHPRARAILLAAVAKDIALAVLCSVLTELGRLMLPVGITIAAFTSVGYLIDLYHMECDPIDDPIRYGVFCCFFGKLPIGPIVSAQQFIPQLEHLQMTAEGITRGMVQFLRGLAKIVILAASLQQLIAQWETLLSLQVTVLGTWLPGAPAPSSGWTCRKTSTTRCKAPRWRISSAGSISPPTASSASMFIRRWAPRTTGRFPPRSTSCSSPC